MLPIANYFLKIIKAKSYYCIVLKYRCLNRALKKNMSVSQGLKMFLQVVKVGGVGLYVHIKVLLILLLI